MPPSSGPSATSFTPGPNVKLGAMKKKCGGLQKWAVRYLILDKPNKILYYYHSTKDASPRRALDLNTCTISRLSADESPKDSGFKVTQPGVRDFVFIGSNAAIVDDWVNAIFQAKAPSQTLAQAIIGNSATRPAFPPPPSSQVSSTVSSTPIKSPTSTSDNFSYNGPTLAVLPNRAHMPMAPPPVQNIPLPFPSSYSPQITGFIPPKPGTPKPPATSSARSTQSSMNENNQSNNNTTLVGNGGGADTNSTLVAGAGTGVGGGGKVPVGQPVPVLILTPDNKKFPPIERPVVGILKIGRYVNNQPQSDDMITFKSKVISRFHSEIWSVNGEVYIRDTKSQSGTFLNAMRLSEPSKESKPYRLKSGDVIQFGVDYKGATEDNARCISVRVDLKTKILEPLPLANVGTGSERSTGTTENETLVGHEGTLVQGGPRPVSGTRMSTNDGTLYNQQATQNESTLYNEKINVPPPLDLPKPPRPLSMPNRPPVPVAALPPRPQILTPPGGMAAVPGMRPPIAMPGARPPPPPMGMQR